MPLWQNSSRESLMKKHASTIILVSIFVVGLLVLLYPTISNYINELSATRAIIRYEDTVNELEQAEYEKILESAHLFNKGLSQSGTSIHGSGTTMEEAYLSELNISGDGMMGYIEIKKLGVNLPIYHGTSDEVLLRYAGHLEGSSLPVGGINTHSVITAHRGLPSARLFTDLDKMEVGDVFQLFIMKEVLTYEVENISIVLPENVSSLNTVVGEDYVTLITCTPYAVNTHRLLVRGTRIETKDDIAVVANAVQIDPLLVAPIVAAPLLVALLIWLLVSTGRKKTKLTANKKEEEQQDIE